MNQSLEAGAVRKTCHDRTTQEESDTGPKPDHVVVFVHGMGEALKGGTLLEWSEPLVRSLHDIALDKIEKAQDEGLLNPAAPAPVPLTIEAAHATGDTPKIYVSAYKPGHRPTGKRGRNHSSPEEERSRLLILLTEAHWANDFAPGKAGPTWLWGFKVARRVWWRALNLLRWNLYPPPNAIKNIPPVRGAWWRIPFYLIAFVSLPALILLLLALGILIGLSKLPGIGGWAEKIVVLFANFLGDPATWNGRPTQAAAMRQKVIDIVESAPDGANVTVVAHSQGAAIAGQVALSGRISPTNLITVGSGLTLLDYAKYGANRCDDPVKEWAQYAPRLRWINLWGKFDFVPAGPMAEKTAQHLEWWHFCKRWEQRKERITKRQEIFKLIYGRKTGQPSERKVTGPEEHAIYNRSAIIRDHIVYSQNRIEVIDPLARLVYDNEPAPTENSPVCNNNVWFTRPDPSPTVTDEDECERGKRHRRMVSFLGMTRVLCIGAGILLALPVMRLIQSWLGAEDGSVGWGTFVIGREWLLPLTVIVITLIFMWFLNGVLWTHLHGKLERRYRHGEPWCGGKSFFFWYAGAVALLTVALPLLLSRGVPLPFKGLYVVVAVMLGIVSWQAGKEILPLPAHPQLHDPLPNEVAPEPTQPPRQQSSVPASADHRDSPRRISFSPHARREPRPRRFHAMFRRSREPVR